jgi:hypothetical protein
VQEIETQMADASPAKAKAKTPPKAGGSSALYRQITRPSLVSVLVQPVQGLLAKQRNATKQQKGQ